MCTVYVSTPHVKTSQISMKWSLERRQGQTSPPAHFDVRSPGKCRLSANQRRVWRHEDQSEGRKTGQWREVRGEEAGKCRCLCGESIMFTDEEIWHNLDIFGIHHNATLLRSYPRLMPSSSPRLAAAWYFRIWKYSAKSLTFGIMVIMSTLSWSDVGKWLLFSHSLIHSAVWIFRIQQHTR